MTNLEEVALEQHQFHKFSFGAIVDYGSRAGKEEKVAIKMAIKDFYTHFIQPPTFHFKNSRGDPVQAASSGESFCLFCTLNIKECICSVHVNF